MSLELRNLRESMDMADEGGNGNHNRLPQPDSPPSRPKGKSDQEKLLPGHRHIHYSRGSIRRFKKREPYLERNAFRSFLSFSWLIHVIALGCTVAAVRLHFANTYWVDEREWNTHFFWSFLRGRRILDILQFAAKLYEIIIVSSLAAMVIHIVRRKLLGDGVPWGLMTGAYQVGSPQYFFSLDLWMPLIRPRTWGNFSMALGLMILAVYANTIGPFTAIVLSPSLEWWPVNDPYNGEKLTSYIEFSRDSVYPQVLDQEPCTGSSYCPDSGVPDLRVLLNAFSKSIAKPSFEIKQVGAETAREIVSSLRYSSDKNGHMAMATTLHASVAELVGEFWHHIDAEDVGFVNQVGRPKFSPVTDDVYAPLVQVQCSKFLYSKWKDSGENPKFYSGQMRNFSTYYNGETDGYTSTREWDVPEDYLDADRDEEALEDMTFEWVDPSELDGEGKPTMAAFVTVPMRYIVSESEDSVEADTDSLMLPCMIDARWAGVETSYDPRADRLLPSNLTNFDALEPYWRGSNDHPGHLVKPSIQMTRDWADALNSETDAETPKMIHLLNAFIDDTDGDFRTANYSKELGRDKLNEEAARAVATTLSMAMAEGLSRVSYESDLGVVLREIDADTVEWKGLFRHAGVEPEEAPRSKTEDTTAIQWKVDRMGWGYGFRTETIKAGVALCLLHAACVVVYAAYNAWFRLRSGGFGSGAWQGFGELIALGLKSRKPGNYQLVCDLAAGVNKRRTLTTNVVVRTTEEEKVEMLIGQDDQGNRLAKGMTYG